MKKNNIYMGNALLHRNDSKVEGQQVMLEGEVFFKIKNYHLMDPFFMSIVSDSDHWMFLSSNGALSAGRKDRDNALFPYYTVDKIHDYQGKTGNKTIVFAQREGKVQLWEPFDGDKNIYRIQRNIYKSFYGNKVVFEEINSDLDLVFRYAYSNSEKFGWVKQSVIENRGSSSVDIDILDGLQNLLPYGTTQAMQLEYSNLLDAYKKNELMAETGLGVFMLNSIPVDRAEPSEALKATTVWALGVNESKIVLSERQLDAFRNGHTIQTETDVRAARGAYLVNQEFKMDKGAAKQWLFVAELNQSSADVANLNQLLKDGKDLEHQLLEDIKAGTRRLVEIVGKADGLQKTGDGLGVARHFSNTLYNVMRGGIFMEGYSIQKNDFIKFISTSNKVVLAQYAEILEECPEQFSRQELLDFSLGHKDEDLIRIAYEYLPLSFSRRHGDPSRPWNKFSIATKNEDGSAKLGYEGNWRDIFQNWEALSLSYPEFIESMLFRFLNASTADGYNPYRITREGIDWEKPDPNDPWAFIGYWGDHQIIYLQKFLEWATAYHPGQLQQLFSQEVFCYANVPYRIKEYTEIVKNPQDTVVFDEKMDAKIQKRFEKMGADGKLILDINGKVYRVNMVEKILATTLAKLSNFIPEAGIWLNTQRPEWNDANNALVGDGTSMVTLYYMRRFICFWLENWEDLKSQSFAISGELKSFLDQLHEIFRGFDALSSKGITDVNRRIITDQLGKAGSSYRQKVYNQGFCEGKREVTIRELCQFFQFALNAIDQTIRANKREDGLYHAYNLVNFKGKNISIRRLNEMLEGQVAVLSSGFLSTEEVVEVLDALKASKLFRADQYSYLLYPDKVLPLFSQKNLIADQEVEKSELLMMMLEEKDNRIVEKSRDGNYHFNGKFRNAEVLKAVLEELNNGKYNGLAEKDKGYILGLYEQVFDHQSFTGRSGAFFGFEGLGSIYWHMVSKLLLAIQENLIQAIEKKEDLALIGRIKDHYYEVKAGIGYNKSVDLYGAFPTDPYSHTPAHAGAQQPGMTGQVKEDVIVRLLELGVRVENGELRFSPDLIHPEEWSREVFDFTYFDVSGEKKVLKIGPKELAFTFCQVPIIYSKSEKPGILIAWSDGGQEVPEERSLSREQSHAIFARTGGIECIKVFF